MLPCIRIFNGEWHVFAVCLFLLLFDDELAHCVGYSVYSKGVHGEQFVNHYHSGVVPVIHLLRIEPYAMSKVVRELLKP